MKILKPAREHYSMQAFILFVIKGMEFMDSGIGSLLIFFQPGVGTFLGWLLLNEEINANFFIGAVLILTGVMIVTFQRKKFNRI